VEPMEARAVAELPRGAHWQYEPKWDGFRCLLNRHGPRVTMQSKSGRDLRRYFPEVVAATLALADERFLLDGELIIQHGKLLSFDDLLQRIHPAASRIRRLADETPATFVAFDLLRLGADDLAGLPLSERRLQLERFAKTAFNRSNGFQLSPATRSFSVAERWLAAAGTRHDGVIAKRRDLPYQAGNRDGMLKIKRIRTADCVVGGFRYAAKPMQERRVVGSLLLGLYDDDGLLHHVGFTSAIKAQDRIGLTDDLEAIASATSFTGRAPGGPSRWSTARSTDWQPVKPQRVVEVSYDHVTNGRFRHGTRILRARPDKRAKQCTMVQIAAMAPRAGVAP
jgi:ATP-dependent DNA ligase